MNPPRPPISNHRLARLLVWARLWLMWFGGFIVELIEIDRKHADEITKTVARFVSEVIILRAMQTFRQRKLARVYGPNQHMPTMRSFIGTRVRKRLAARDPIVRFFNILTLLRDLDAEVLRFSKRIARGLTRWRSTCFEWTNEATIALSAPEASPTNTS